VTEIFRRPRHAYTLGLLNSVPRAGVMRQPLASIPGQPPLLSDLPRGCAFAPRCRFVVDACRQGRPPLVEVEPAHRSACIRHETLAAG